MHFSYDQELVALSICVSGQREGREAGKNMSFEWCLAATANGELAGRRNPFILVVAYGGYL